jgi:hypothetical protein
MLNELFRRACHRTGFNTRSCQDLQFEIKLATELRFVDTYDHRDIYFLTIGN